MRDKSVLISGAGIGGPTLAYWLSVAGFRPTLIERAPELRSGGYVIDFWGLGYDIAERMGLLNEINRIGYHMREFRIVGGEGKRLTGFGTSVFRELTDGRFVTLGRSDLSRLLFQKAKDASEVIFGDEIVALREQADGVHVRFRDGGERRFDLVIGADGLHSAVRRIAFGPQDAFEKSLGYAVAAVEVAGYRPREENVYLMYGMPGRMLGRVALREDQTLFLFVLTAEEPLPETLQGQKGMLRRRYADGGWECPRILDDVGAAKEFYFDRVSQIRMGRWSKGRVALVGDAAFCVSLAAGQGSALAIISAYVLAGELLRAGGQYEAAFQNYEAILRNFIATKQRGAGRFASALAPRTRFGLWFRNQVIRSFAIPGLAKFAIGRDITDSLRLPDYAWPSGALPSRIA